MNLFHAAGRRHRIIVHLSAIGHPILGEPLYGGSDEEYLGFVRQECDPSAQSPGDQIPAGPG